MEVGETQAAVDVVIVCECGVSITDLATGVRRNIIKSIEGMTGLEVVEVNIAVDDVHLPESEEEEGASTGPGCSETSRLITTGAAAGGRGPAADVRGFDPGRIAAAAIGCRLVSRLTAGPFGASVYLPGRRVPGVEASGRRVRVHVVGRYGHPIAQIGAQVRDAVAAAAPDAVVDVVVEDLDPDDPPAGGPAC